ncbi:hypothetical protein EJB05_32488 [Eragrostis curvula]|uniref:Phytocyanin domain-containing protein n=1 Tax=Eragrostis curvula TaxID=38414 RepID=A0A5J9UHZ0_9POAL|nr:hypothetical protein EJB05_32488 [Eragrostis curvula]
MASPLGEITLSLLLVLLTASGGCAGRDFIVGNGPYGWTINPAVPRDHFQINDTLDFKYDKDLDAVLWVTQSQYEVCNTTEPNLRLVGGESRFVLVSSGYYYFISADDTRCQAGERLIVFVRAAYENTPPAPPPKPSSSSSAPPPPPPKPASPSTTPVSPPPVRSPTASASPPPPPPNPPAGNGGSSPSPAPMTAPVPRTKNGTGPSSTSSSAVALRAVVLACLVIGATAAIL